MTLRIQAVTMLSIFLFAHLLSSILAQQQQLATQSIKISSFNIQVFGQTKMSKPEVVQTLLKITSMYDLIFIMEVRDSSNTTIPEFTRQLNNFIPSTSVKYQFQISEPLGRTSSKEQYAILYKPNIIKFVKTLQYLDVNNWFERPPFLFVFELVALPSQIFSLLGCHIKPTDAVAEMNHLVDVFNSYQNEAFANQTIMCGDFNAGCSYVTSSDWNSISLRTDSTRFKWLINDTTDTTVATSECPYDRFVVPTSMAQNNILKLGSKYEISQVASVFRFDERLGLNSTFAATVSDHYPIEMTIQVRVATTSSSGGPKVSQSTPRVVSSTTRSLSLSLFIILVIVMVQFLCGYWISL
ncbi:hypothetical protein C9374_000658 [Naegleria lovaniensis]|uniref:Endonuclease/exonuclease/phosphatase domain-containing protein n=1 Tax=Naegleria lovaniensis TaxID=51637 RepID=A0AA88KNX0_NAELO|nr:uncharacterized protein C9374_000658 [Naegleria lovaniensis]KAG2388494.1 hypothetical protein C9374_000658 [Naegleria lovaniensis]